MTRKAAIKIDASAKELVKFLEKLRVEGELRVELNGEFLRISLARETTSKGRDFLTSGGVLDDD